MEGERGLLEWGGGGGGGGAQSGTQILNGEKKRAGKVERIDRIDKNKPAQNFSILALTRSLAEEPSNAAKT